MIDLILLLGALSMFIAFLVLAKYLFEQQRLIGDLLRRLDEERAYVFASRQCGVYAIVNTQTRAQYIGGTTVNFLARWGQHIADLSKGRHVNQRLQDDWNALGGAVFAFVILEVIEDVGVIPDRERELIEHYTAQLPPVLNYNVAYGRVRPAPRLSDTPALTSPQPARRSRRVHRPTMAPSDKPFSLADLNLTPEEIEGLGLDLDEENLQ